MELSKRFWAVVFVIGKSGSHQHKACFSQRRCRGKQAIFASNAGNHEVWLSSSQQSDSVEKFKDVIRLCEEQGVHCTPIR